MKTGKTDTRALDVDTEERSQIGWGKGLGGCQGVFRPQRRSYAYLSRRRTLSGKQ